MNKRMSEKPEEYKLLMWEKKDPVKEDEDTTGWR